MTDIKIEKGVLLPKRKMQSKYPWAEMKVGDSILIPYNKAESARVAARTYSRRHGGRFTSRREGDGIRIWRAA